MIPSLQPRPQGFSLKKWVGPPIFEGKSPGDEVAESGRSRSLNAEETIRKEIKGASTLGARALVPEYDTRWALI